MEQNMTAEHAICHHCDHDAADARAALRSTQLARALRLEYLTVGWNLVEGIVAISAAVVAGSVALLGFGIDSFVESASGSVMIWRLHAERRARLSHGRIEALEHRARRLVAASLFLLAAWIAVDAAQTLWRGDRPEFSAVGVALTAVSLVVMFWLARAKRRVARELGSRAMEADAFQTTACWWLSVAALTGIGLNGALGWWWADPVAGVVIAGLVVKEGRDAWEGEQDCC
jgi:divalent metal cation (Fe/Co/Zn/Cd) transporter